MSFNPILPSSGSGANNTQINKLAADVRGSKVTQVFKDATDRRVLLGRGKGDFYGLKVSKPGVDVYDATDSQLIFNSDQNVFKIVGEGTASDVGFTTTAFASNHNLQGGATTITHNLGFKPIVIAFLVNNDAGLTPLPYVANNYKGLSTPGFVTQTIRIQSVTDTTFQIYRDQYVNAYSSGVDVLFTMPSNTYKYYLLQETAADN
jgi:hypothetical protein